MLTLHFSGWLQVRLATDPDPFDEPRGVSGYVRTLPGEPDFDRVIRLHRPVAPRVEAPEVGVFVRSVALHGVVQADHPLIGSQVDWLDGPKFEGRNGIIAEDVLEPILPFHFEIRRDGFLLRRMLGGNYEHPFRPLWGEGVPFTPEDWRETLGTDRPAAYLAARRERLITARAAASDPIEQAALDQRITFLANPGHAGRFSWGMEWNYPLAGSHAWVDEPNTISGNPDAALPWITRFRVGIWDADSLCAYLRGSLEVPLR